MQRSGEVRIRLVFRWEAFQACKLEIYSDILRCDGCNKDSSMFLCVPSSAGKFPVEIKISGEQLVQITNTGNKSYSLEETAYIGLCWFKRDETKGNCTEEHFSGMYRLSAWNKEIDKVAALSSGKLRQPGRLNMWAKCLLLSISLKHLSYVEMNTRNGKDTAAAVLWWEVQLGCLWGKAKQTLNTDTAVFHRCDMELARNTSYTNSPLL